MGSSVTAVMLLVECLEVGMNTVNKAANTRGMSEFVFIAYSNALAIFVLLLSSFVFYRKRSFPPLTVSILCKIFLVGVISSCVQICLYNGIRYSSPTLASAISDLTPAFTFLLAIISRMEKLDLRVESGCAKSIGTIVSITGALVVTLYKGRPLTSTPSNQLVQSTLSNWVFGGILLAIGSFLLAVLYVVQAVFTVTIRSVIHTWGCRKKGPVYVSMFKPLGMVIAIMMGVTFLGDTLYLGSVVGAVIIALGFYAVIWGQAQDEKTIGDCGICNYESSSSKVPLLKAKIIEVYI